MGFYPPRRPKQSRPSAFAHSTVNSQMSMEKNNGRFRLFRAGQRYLRASPMEAKDIGPR